MSAVVQEKTTERSTTIAELRTGAQPREANMPVVRAGFSDLAGFELVQRAAKALAASTLVPKEYQGNIPNCIVALELAQRIGASPLMVMQNLAIIHGKPSWSSKFLIAAVNQCGRFEELQFEWGGTEGKDDWSCRAWTTSKTSGRKVQGPKITIDMAKKEGWFSKSGSKWQTIPELMLMYRAGGWFANTNAPELTMGLNTQEEMHDVIDVTETEPGRYESNVGDLRQTDAPAATSSTGHVEEPPRVPPAEITLDTVLGYIAKADTEDKADIALDLGKGKLDKVQWARAVEARNARVRELKPE